MAKLEDPPGTEQKFNYIWRDWLNRVFQRVEEDYAAGTYTFDVVPSMSTATAQVEHGLSSDDVDFGAVIQSSSGSVQFMAAGVKDANNYHLRVNDFNGSVSTINQADPGKLRFVVYNDTASDHDITVKWWARVRK